MWVRELCSDCSDKADLVEPSTLITPMSLHFPIQQVVILTLCVALFHSLHVLVLSALLTALLNTLLLVSCRGGWFSIIFFLTYVGGLLVLLFYVVSISPSYRAERHSCTLRVILSLPLLILYSSRLLATSVSVIPPSHSDYLLASSCQERVLSIFVLLLFVMWLCFKLVSVHASALRPFF